MKDWNEITDNSIIELGKLIIGDSVNVMKSLS